ncbi:bifunctional glycosyltransferase/CDP-glycerol:glycerophosphate glycerophosphotransferase [Arthrobacter ginkgonis]|uniref:bifunctional glycosyltransferase/CDP-glycerol:glycerophosphate glycerophosphotransferase n=1 Tax=Arthrobacter ginkgonis TaxID=1630594 RepID=UPI0031F07AF4
MTPASAPLQPTRDGYRLTVISAVYNVARYLPEFIASLEAQTFDHGRVQVVAVDDGSTDESADLLRAWARDTRYAVTVLSKENGGQSSARNLGLDAASGDWVTFADPDDMLDPEYFTQIEAFLAKNPEAAMAATNLLDFHELTGETRNTHPLRHRFTGGDRLVDLDRHPNFFHMSGGTSVFPLRALQDLGLRFDLRVAPTFEDAHFIQRFLLASPDRKIAYLESARYLYRRRADGSSTLQTSRRDPRKYTDVLEYGLLDLLQRAKAQAGPVPRWLQNAIIYDLTWHFRAEESANTSAGKISADTAAQFHRLVAEIRSHLDPSVIDSFTVVRRSPTQREALLHGYSAEPWHSEEIFLDRLDQDRQLVRLRYRFAGTPPTETLRLRGLPVEPVHAKTRAHTYFREPLLTERILWVSAAGSIEVDLNGVRMPLTFTEPAPQKPYSVRPSQIRQQSEPEHAVPELSAKRIPAVELPKVSAEDRRILRFSSLRPVRRLFANAWVLMDRDENANDSAEHLFRYLRKHRRDINAWFVLKKDTPDWHRLKKEGFKRLVPHGSLLWKALCLNARHIVSSHADVYVHDPFRLGSGHKPTWKFTFLQHGVIKDDLSRWLNAKPITNFVTTTPAEFASIAGNGSPYVFTTRETHLTGLPRHDRLARLARKASAKAEKRSIVVMPTWRQDLAGLQLQAGGWAREINPAFFESEFHHEWSGVLRSPRLAALAREHGLEVVFVPHPNLKPYVPLMELPAHVTVKTYDQDDVQEILSRAAVVVTDYSSVAFDAAFIRRPIAYFQFDKAAVFGGAHITKPGYFSYERDGFGPVATGFDELMDNVAAALDPAGTAGTALEEYRERMERTFTLPQDGACARVTAMVERSTVPLSVRKAHGNPTAAPEAPPITYELFNAPLT